MGSGAGSAGSGQGPMLWLWKRTLTLVRGTLGDMGSGRAGTQGLMLPCPGAWEHGSGVGVIYFGLLPQQW